MRYESEFWHIISTIYTVIVTGCGQALLGIPEVMPNCQVHLKNELRNEVEYLHMVKHL